MLYEVITIRHDFLEVDDTFRLQGGDGLGLVVVVDPEIQEHQGKFYDQQRHQRRFAELVKNKASNGGGRVLCHSDAKDLGVITSYSIHYTKLYDDGFEFIQVGMDVQAVGGHAQEHFRIGGAHFSYNFV